MSNIEIIALSGPFILVLLSLALTPLLAPKFWKKNEVLTLAILSISSILTSSIITNQTMKILWHSLAIEYLPFIIMLFSLYVLSSGIRIKIKSNSSTINNITFLFICSIFSSIIGTTGASMLFLKPFLEMNKHRKNIAHLVVFFIFLVSNIGGILSPLGDPPLLLGYLKGIEFSWFFKNLYPIWGTYVVVCLSALAIIDRFMLNKEKSMPDWLMPHYNKTSISINGKVNIVLILSTIFILFVDIDKYNLPIPSVILKNIILIFFCVISILHSKKRSLLKLDMKPFKEVAWTFLVIFIVIAPVLFALSNHADDIHKYITSFGNDHNSSIIYFWLCGIASSFLDNAPSYLLFFNIAGGNANELMHVYPEILKAISTSAVVMGAMTYIGNAPNMMVRSVAEKHGIKMPSFLSYMLWAFIIIVPISVIISYVVR